MAVYNLTNFTNADTVVDLAVASNNIVDGWLFVLISALVFIIVFTVSGSYNAKERFGASAFITFILNSMLWAAGLVSAQVVLICFVLVLAGIVALAID